MDAACLIRYEKMILNELGFFQISLRLVNTFTPILRLAICTDCGSAQTQVITSKGAGLV